MLSRLDYNSGYSFLFQFQIFFLIIIFFTTWKVLWTAAFYCSTEDTATQGLEQFG